MQWGVVLDQSSLPGIARPAPIHDQRSTDLRHST
jgi:hypothetical protein